MRGTTSSGLLSLIAPSVRFSTNVLIVMSFVHLHIGVNAHLALLRRSISIFKLDLIALSLDLSYCKVYQLINSTLI